MTGSLQRSGHGRFALPWLGVGLTAGVVGLYLAGPAVFAALVLDRAAVAAGEVWRLVTGHLVHIDLEHLAWNVGALALLVACLELGCRRGVAAVSVSLAAGTAAVSLVVLALAPHLDLYAGLSGALNALYVAALVMLARRTGHWVFLALIAADAAKIVVEGVVGGALFTATAWPPVPVAHAAGWLAGLAVAPLIARWTQPPT